MSATLSPALVSHPRVVRPDSYILTIAELFDLFEPRRPVILGRHFTSLFMACNMNMKVNGADRVVQRCSM